MEWFESWSNTFIEYACSQGEDFAIVFLVRIGLVCRVWRQALEQNLRSVGCVTFGKFRHVVGGEVAMQVLSRFGGANLRMIDLSGCRLIGPDSIEQMLSGIDERCPGLRSINVEGCRLDTVLLAVAMRAKILFGISSPECLFDRIVQDSALRSSKFLCIRLMDAKLLVDVDQALRFELRQHEWREDDFLLQVSKHGSAWVAALLLSLNFDAGNSSAIVFDCNLQDEWGMSPIHFAAERRDKTMASVLIHASAHVNCVDQQGNSPLMVACAAGCCATAQLLLDCRAQLSATNQHGSTALMVACRTRKHDVVALLLEADAGVHVVQRDGASPLAYSILSQDVNLLQMVLKYQHNGIIQGTCGQDPCSFLRQLVGCFLDQGIIEECIRHGQSAHQLVSEIGSLIRWTAKEPSFYALHGHLREVRVFLNRHKDILKDISKIQMPHPLIQLAKLELDSSSCNESHCVTNNLWLDCCKVANRADPCMLTIDTVKPPRCLVYSPNGSYLFRTEGNSIVACDSVTCLELFRMTGHRYVDSFVK
jgi:ankyrin repeat protein